MLLQMKNHQKGLGWPRPTGGTLNTGAIFDRDGNCTQTPLRYVSPQTGDVLIWVGHNIHMHTCTCTYTHTRKHIDHFTPYLHQLTHTRTNIHTHNYTHIHTHIHTHTYTHTPHKAKGARYISKKRVDLPVPDANQVTS